MKNLWPTAIIGVLLLSAAGSLTVLYISSKQDNALVTKDYYEDALQYDKVKEKNQNRINNAADILFTYDSTSQVLKAEFSGKTGNTTGTLLFYNPVFSKEDFTVDIKTDSGIQYVDLKKIQSGLWKIKADWKQDSIAYLQEYKLMKK